MRSEVPAIPCAVKIIMYLLSNKSVQFLRDTSELFQSRLKILDDLFGDHVRLPPKADAFLIHPQEQEIGDLFNPEIPASDWMTTTLVRATAIALPAPQRYAPPT